MTTQTTTMQPVRLSNLCWAVPSSSDPGTEYIVEATNGGFTCTCKAFRYRGKCRHIVTVQSSEQPRDDERPCTARPRPNTELGLYLISGGTMGSK
jgi:hypothetical protein